MQPPGLDEDDNDEDREVGGEFDPEARALCHDGSCTGVIGDDGRCKVCGHAGDASGSAEAGATHGEEGERAHFGEVGEVIEAGSDGEIDSRELCPDGNCIGVMGDDGRCKVCGRGAEAR